MMAIILMFNQAKRKFINFIILRHSSEHSGKLVMYKPGEQNRCIKPVIHQVFHIPWEDGIIRMNSS